MSIILLILSKKHSYYLALLCAYGVRRDKPYPGTHRNGGAKNPARRQHEGAAFPAAHVGMLRVVFLAIPQPRLEHAGVVRGNAPARTVVEHPVGLDWAFPAIGNSVGLAGLRLDCEGPHEEELHLEGRGSRVLKRNDFGKDVGTPRCERKSVGEGEMRLPLCPPSGGIRDP